MEYHETIKCKKCGKNIEYPVSDENISPKDCEVHLIMDDGPFVIENGDILEDWQGFGPLKRIEVKCLCGNIIHTS